MQESLTFYVTGESFTNLIYGFFEEGSYKSVLDILEDSQMSREQITKIFEYKAKFHGDSREDSLSLEVLEERTISEKEYDSILMAGIRTALSQYNRENDSYYEMHSVSYVAETDKNLGALLEIIPIETINSRLWKKMLRDCGYVAIEKDFKSRDLANGVILRNGNFVPCPYMGHINLYPVLYCLGLANSSEWTEDDLTIHVTSYQISGGATRGLQRYSTGEETISKEQIQFLIDNKKFIKSIYGEHETIVRNIYDKTVIWEDAGGKYGGLKFINRVFPNIVTPKFSKEPIPEVKNCLRTSPDHSLPGLLESKFDLDDNSINEMVERFEKYKDVIPGNKLNYFYQEFIEGLNGVFHVQGRDSVFTYQVSGNQGDVVKGKSSKIEIPLKTEKAIRNIAMEIHEAVQEPIQCEFVISDNKIYIVQFRILKNSYEETVISQKPANPIATGLTFSRGTIMVDVNDILVVEDEIESDALLGKKALVVKNNVEFSHILALSKTLKIPSIYGTGNFDLPKEGEVKFQAYNKNGYISE